MGNGRFGNIYIGEGLREEDDKGFGLSKSQRRQNKIMDYRSDRGNIEAMREKNKAKLAAAKKASEKRKRQISQDRRNMLEASGAEKDWKGDYKEDTAIKSEGSDGTAIAEKALSGGELVSDIVGVGQDSTSTSDQVASNALKYASLGGQIGQGPGMIAGAVIGGTLGAIKARQARKAEQAKIEAEKQEELAKIEGDKGERIQRAMSRLGEAFSRNLNRQLNVRL